MGIKFGHYWNHGSPFLFVYCADAEAARATQIEFSLAYGYKAGSIQDAVLRISGHAAVEFLKFHKQPLGDYADWTPKNDSRKYWRLQDEAFVADAKKYKTKGEWRIKSNGYYQHVFKHRRHLIGPCTAHMVSAGRPFNEGYQVYAYEFFDHTVYIGLTCNPNRRHKDHSMLGSVAAKIRAGLSFEFKELGTGLMPTPAAQLEVENIAKYRLNGWQVLNVNPGGSTGNIRSKYAYASLLELARPFKNRKQFYVAHTGVYQYACTHKLLGKIANELGWPDHAGHVWTKEKCFQSAQRFKWISDWLMHDAHAYQAVQRNGWLPEIKQALFTINKPVQLFWTKEACAARVASFKSRVEWQYGCKDGSYVSARRKGWLDEIATAAFGPRRNRWSRS